MVSFIIVYLGSVPRILDNLSYIFGRFSFSFFFITWVCMCLRLWELVVAIRQTRSPHLEEYCLACDKVWAGRDSKGDVIDYLSLFPDLLISWCSGPALPFPVLPCLPPLSPVLRSPLPLLEFLKPVPDPLASLTYPLPLSPFYPFSVTPSLSPADAYMPGRSHALVFLTANYVSPISLQIK